MYKISKSLLGILLLLMLTLHCGAQDEMQRNETAKRAYDRTDAQLKKAYQSVLSKYAHQKKFIRNLKTAQRLWEEYKIAQVATKFPEIDVDPFESYGRGFPACYYNYMRALTAARLETLSPWLHKTEEQDECLGSVGAAAE